MTEGTEGHPADAGVVAGAAPSADLVADLEHELRETRQASIAALLTGTALIRVAAARTAPPLRASAARRSCRRAAIAPQPCQALCAPPGMLTSGNLL